MVLAPHYAAADLDGDGFVTEENFRAVAAALGAPERVIKMFNVYITFVLV